MDQLLPSKETRGEPSPASEPENAPEIITELEWRRRERDNIHAALERAGGRIYGPDGAATLLGVKPTTLMSRLQALGLQRPAIRRRT